MKEFTCIVCPNGCSLVYDETTHKVTGNRCPRGAKYAENEMTHPMRSLTSTVRTTLPEYPVISVRTSLEVPKGMIPEVMKLFRSGDHVTNPKTKDYVIYERAKHVVVESVKPVAYAIDGEVFRKEKIVVDILPQDLSFVIPSDK